MSQYSQYDSTYCKVDTCCAYCSYVMATEKKTHVYGSGYISTASTCTTSSVYTKVCNNCGYKNNINDYSPALGHDYVLNGNYTSISHTLKCSRCSATKSESHNLNNGSCACGYVQNSSSGSSGSSGGSGSSGSYSTSVVSVTAGQIAATKLDAKRASITVTCPYGSTFTEVYCNGKLIKTLASSGNFVWKAKGAASARYKTRSTFNQNGTNVTSGFSGEVKPAKNIKVYPYAGSYNPRNMGTYGTNTHKTSKLSFSGKKLKCTAYIYNNRMFRLKKIKIHYYLRVNGKVYRKTLTKTVNVKPYGKKKISYYIGSGISDIRNGITYKSVYTDGNWGFGWNR